MGIHHNIYKPTLKLNRQVECFPDQNKTSGNTFRNSHIELNSITYPPVDPLSDTILVKLSKHFVRSNARNLRLVDAETLSAIAAVFMNRNEGKWWRNMAKNTTKTSTKSAPSQLLFESTWFVYTDNNRRVHTEFAVADYCITM